MGGKSRSQECSAKQDCHGVPEKRGWELSSLGWDTALPPFPPRPPSNSIPLLLSLFSSLLSPFCSYSSLSAPSSCLPHLLSPFLPSLPPKLFHDNGLTRHIMESARYSGKDPTQAFLPVSNSRRGGEVGLGNWMEPGQVLLWLRPRLC